LGAVLGRYDTLLESHSANIVIIADANLYREELEMIISYAKSIDAKLYIPMESYIDDNFGDDWLRSSQRASNAKAVEQLSIPTTISDEKISLLIDFNHPDVDCIDADRVISLRTNKYSAKSDIVLPLASYVESSGTLVNEDGVEQYLPKVINAKDPIATISEWLSKLDRSKIGGDA
jgi:NADH-quinone oxidoreductase subunit G